MKSISFLTSQINVYLGYGVPILETPAKRAEFCDSFPIAIPLMRSWCAKIADLNLHLYYAHDPY